MADAKQILDQYFFEMRWRCLSLAADLDRVERADGGRALLDADLRLQKLRVAINVLLKTSGPQRAEQVQLIFSDKTPPPGGARISVTNRLIYFAELYCLHHQNLAI